MPSRKKTVQARPHAVVKKASTAAAASAKAKKAAPLPAGAAAAGAAAAATELALAAAEGSDPSTSNVGAPSRVVYIGHLPRGFYEDQLKGYFSQFGTVTRVRVSRNKKTARARSYAFLEFGSPDVAAIAAEAMDGYLMFAQRLAVRVIPSSAVHPALFKGANRKFAKVPWRRVEAARANADRSPAAEAKRASRARGRDRARAERIKAAGIEYEYAPLSGKAVDGKAVEGGGGAAGRATKRKAAGAAAAAAPAAKKKAAAPAAKTKAPATAPAAKKKAAAAAPATRASKRVKK